MGLPRIRGMRHYSYKPALESLIVSIAPRVIASRVCPWFSVMLRDDGILAYHPVSGLELNHEVAMKVLELGVEVAGGPKPTLVVMPDMARVDREARALFASDAYSRLCSQTALVVGSPVSRVIGSFFVGLNRPRYPYRIFSDPELAVDWLRGFVQ